MANDSSSTDPKTIIVTGGNAGIGFATAHQLADAGHHVVIVSRNLVKGQDALTRIKDETGNESVECVQGDLSTIASVNELADTLCDRYPRIDVLINNAGVWMTKRVLNDDGLEMTFMVNHIAPYILSIRLLDCLKAAKPARIVSVNAGLYMNGECDLDLLPEGKNFGRFKTYMHTKLCNVLFSMELAQRLEGTGVTVNALHPGVINTNLGVSPGLLGRVIQLVKKTWGTIEEGARPVVRLAIDPNLEGITGRYYDIETEVPLTPNAERPGVAADLWKYTEERTGITLT